MARLNWKTRFGLYLAAIGSACGLGNLWRFPYVVGENGGGAFVLLYVLVALVLGLPLMIGELFLGRSQRAAIIPATQKLGNPRFSLVGKVSVCLVLLLLAYFAIISGWVLFFFVQFVKAIFVHSDVFSLKQIVQNEFLQIGLTSVHLIFCMIVVAKGVQEGIERWIGSIIPLFAVLLVFLIYESMSLPSSVDALRFLFYPSFSGLTWFSLGQAIGHVCFTLSVGLGMLVTFGSYMKESDHIPVVGFRITILDTVLSMAAGLLIFPIALSASHVPLTDPGLLFEALPTFLLERRGGEAFGAAFFLCLYLAALGASIGLFEVIVSNMMYLRKQSRAASTYFSAAIVFSIAVICAVLGVIVFENQAARILVFLDSMLMNWLIPLIALGLCWVFAKGLNKTELEKAFVHENQLESSALFPHWLIAVKYGIPALIILGLILQTVGVIVR